MSSDSNEQRKQTADITNLQESFLQQQEKISALKELVRKSGAAHGSSKSAAQEKVKNIAELLMKSKAKSKQGLNVSTYSTEVTSQEASLSYEEKPSSLNISQASPMPSHSSTPNPTPSKLPPPVFVPAATYSTPGSEKIALMRQQLEQNKLRMAKKASSKQHLEQLVSQLKEKFDSTQQCLEDTSELGRSMSDLSHLIYTPVSRERHKSATDLSAQSFSLEKERIKFLENRCRLLEKQLEKEKQNKSHSSNQLSVNQDSDIRIQDLENTLSNKQTEWEQKEKSYKDEINRLQNIIDSHVGEQKSSQEDDNVDTERITLLERIEALSSENDKLIQKIESMASQLQTYSCDEINQLREPADTCELRSENELLKKELDMQLNRIKELTETNDVLEPADTCELRSENELLKKELDMQLNRIKELTETNDVLETARCDLTSKGTKLEEQIKQLQADVIVAQEKLRISQENLHQLQATSDSDKKSSENTDTDSKVRAEMAKQIQELMDEILELRKENSNLQQKIDVNEKLEINDSSIAEKISSLEATIESQREDLLKSQEALQKNEEELMEKTIELNVLNANFKVLEEKMENITKAKPLFSSSITGQSESGNEELESENQQLKQKLDESNKAMIKLKLKCKQTEKQIEKLKKGSDLHQEVVKLGKEKEQLQQKITELEDEKGQWQLTQVVESSATCSHDEIIKGYEEKIAMLTTNLQEKEHQFDTLKQGEQIRVKSELIEIQLEEQVKELNEEVTSLRNELENKEKSLQTANEEIEVVKQQKDELDKKLEHYLNENLELLDKVEKLSKSSSSAESIEIVERLTQQEKQELEEFNKRLETGGSQSEMSSHKDSVNELTQTEMMNPELTESLNKLREESSELMSKIELFTNERREVLEKMEHLTSENHELIQRIEDLIKEKGDLETKLDASKNKESDLLNKLEVVSKEKNSLCLQIAESKAQKNQLSQELTSLQQSSEVVAALENGDTLFEKCEKSLSKLSCELEAYRKANDKKSKFNISKKLAKEAENAHTQLTELLVKVKEASSAVETVTVVETVVAVTAPNGKALAEYEQLTAQNRELKASNIELRRLLDEARYNQDEQNDNNESEERPAAIKQDLSTDSEVENRLEDALRQNETYEVQLTELQSKVEDLTRELYESRSAESEKSVQITQLSAEISTLKQLSEDFDRVINDKEMTHEKQVEQITRLRKELESKCDTYEQEMEILQTLVTEQKQQLIEAYKEHEHEMNIKLLELQQHDQQVRALKQELVELKQSSSLVGSELTKELQKECEKLKDALKINKNLVQEQLNELSNKQETIDTLNQQIIDLYKTMEDNTNKIIEKEDEISYLQDDLNRNKKQLEELEIKLVESDRDMQHQLQKLSEMQTTKSQLEQRNKEQLDKLKKYAANLKKKALQCQDLETKLKEIQNQMPDAAEFDSLRAENKNLLEKLESTMKQLSSKEEELLDVNNIRKALEQEVKQLQLAIDEKESSIKTFQANALQSVVSDWGTADDVETEQMQQDLLITQEELRMRNQEIEDLKKALTNAEDTIEILEQQQAETASLRVELQSAQKTIIKLEGELASTRTNKSDWEDTGETEDLRVELESAKNTILRLEAELVSALQETSDWGDNTEIEKLQKELQSAQNTIQKLESELLMVRQETSDWGDSGETEQIRVELLCTQENLALKTREIEELRQSLMAAQEQQSDWGNATSVKNADYENLSKVLADKSSQLEKAESVIDELENEIMILREKDSENLQKIDDMRKELQNKTNPMEEEHNELITLKNEFSAQEQRLKEVSEELKAKSIKFEKSKAVIKERNGQIQRLQAQLKDLQEKLSATPEEEVISPTNQSQVDCADQPSLKAELQALQEAYTQLNEKYINEKATFQQTITRLETLHDGIQAKLQEDMSYIETLEQENYKFKDKIGRLEECVACFEERRASMERKVNIMDAQLQSSSEEHAKAEDELIYRLNMLSEHDEVIAQRLLDSQSDKEEMEENFRRLQTDHNQLQTKYSKLEREYAEFKSESSNEFEQELATLRDQLTKSEADLERQRAIYDGKLASKATELDELECELNDQLQQLNDEKRELSEKLERLTDDCTLHQNEILRLQESVNTLEQAKTELERETSWLRMQSENSQQDLYDLQELRMQSMQDKTEIENLRHQIESLSANHENELQALRNQIAELDTLRMQVGQGQNQTDDQVFIETENKRLTDLLAEKESIIENYQRQNLQLQMAATAASSTTGNHSSDPFALAFGIPPQNAVPVPNIGHTTDPHETERLSIELSEKNTLISRLQQDLNTLQAEFNKVLEGNQDMQRQLNERPQEVTNLQTLQNVASALTDAQPSDVIPAPPMFFTSDSHVRSPFDDIIQPVTVESVSLAPPQHTVEQATIEDLQRNVSDLEKHAQDLEHKLAMRNQRESEYEDRLRDFESRFQDRELLLQQTKMELQSVQDEHEKLIANQAEVALLQNEIGALRQQVSNLDCLLQQKDQELDHLRSEHLKQRDELQLKKTINSLESQIIDPTIQPTLDMFFGNAPAQDFEPFVIPQVSAEPVVEEIIVPKKVYDCHPEEKHDKLEIGGDDWGDSWGNNDAAAEAEHFAKHTASVTGSAPTSLVPREQLLEIQMQDLNERLQELQLSLERSEEQKKELHIKSGKLMKKLKEYKVKIEELQSSTNSAVFRKSSSIESNSMFGDLDAAIQEEMKNQIKTLETKLSEQLKQQEHFNVEKEKLLKRIDVLTSGNDRMTEMKERQDMEVQMYQARIRELQQKLQTLDDWGTDSNTNEPSQMTVTEVHSQSTVANSNEGALQEKINALTLEIQDISSDRLELQALLEEEKANSQRAEQTVESLRQKLAIFEDNKPTDDMTQLNNLRIEMKNLQESYNNLLDANKKQSFEFQTQADVLSLSQSNELRLQSEVDKLQAEAENLKETLANTKQSLIDLESELSSLKELKEKQLDAAINKPVNPSSQQLEILQSEKQLLEEQVRILNEENEALKGTLVERTQIEHDHKALEERIQNLQAENDYLKQATVGGSSCDELSAQLQEKESEILHLKQRINDLMNEDQTEKLVLEILTKNQEIQLLKMQVKELEEDKHELENNLSIQITKDMQANKDDVNKVPAGTSREQELENQVDELLTEKKHMEEELQVLNNHIMESLKQEDKMKLLTLELDTKNVEISELRKTIETLQNNSGGVGMTAKSDVSLDYAALNAQWESVVEQRCGEIAKMWQDHLAQRELDFKAQEERLRTEINALRSNHSSNVTIEPVQNVVSAETSSESTTASGTTSAETSQDGTPLRIRPQDNDANVDAIIEQMQNALESQEMEIVTLKEQLAIRSAEYARLAAQYDPFKLQNTSSHIGIVESRKSAVTPDVATVSKSELDLALYMLHQRDMRCEEMTLELVSLLEERDTLQLKLSNTLRQMETIKAKTAGSGLTDASSSSVGPSNTQIKNDNIANMSVAGSTAADDELSLKLSQLHTVSHAKDKVIKEEREQRIRQMEKLQQDVAKMPQAAVSELTGTDSSQVNQPTSNVLLNWLWGNKSGQQGQSPPDF